VARRRTAGLSARCLNRNRSPPGGYARGRTPYWC
jgi:hypothetical protein